MSASVRSRSKKDSREIVGLVFVWLMVAGACVSVLLFSVMVVCANVWIGGVFSFVAGGGLFLMIRHVLRLTKQPY